MNNDVCSGYPCVGKIKIIQVNKINGNTPNWLVENDTITAIFKYTLAPTPEKYFPNISKKYSGLKINDIFDARIEYRITSDVNEICWVVYEYYLENEK